MTAEVDHDLLNDALRRCGATWNAAQTHGLLSSRLAVAGADSGPEWLGQVLDGTHPSSAPMSAPVKECVEMLGELFDATEQALSECHSAFCPLLPADTDAASLRAEAIAHWSEGYLHGLVSGEHAETLRARLAAEPLADIIKDMLQITRAAVDGAADEEANDEAYVDIVEYLRVAAQLVYEELAEFRPEGPNEID